MRPEETAGTPWLELLAGTALVHQQALDRLDVPALLMELPSRRIRAANRAVADLFATSVADIVGKVNSEVVHFADEAAMTQAMDAISAGAIDGYRARRHIVARDGVAKDVYAWARAVEIEGERQAVFLVNPVGTPITPPLGWAGALVVGKVDADWVIKCISSDVSELLGIESGDVQDRNFLEFVDPHDVHDMLTAVRASPLEGTTARHIGLLHADGHRIAAICMFVRLGGEPRSPFAFTLLPAAVIAPEPPAHDRLSEMELSLRRIAAELRAAGVMDDLDRLPPTADFPQLGSLSSRQWHILVRLLRGERVPTIARELYISQGTVRNHLAMIFERFGVHSQAELLALLRKR